MSALPDRRHGGDQLRRAPRHWPTARHIMTPERRSHRATSARPQARMRMLVSRPPSPCRSAAPNPIFSDCSKAQLPGPHSPNHRRQCPNVCSTPVPEAFNTHRHDDRASGLVQDVLRSLARIPAAEPRRRGLCAAPANVKRSTLRKTLYLLRPISPAHPVAIAASDRACPRWR